MKIKTIGLLLSSSLILAACSSGEEDDANVNTTETEGGPLVEEEASEDEEQETGTEHGGTEQDAATEENTPDEGADNGEETDSSTAANPAGASNPNTDAGESESTETEGSSNNTDSDSSMTNRSTIALEDISMNADDAISIAEGEVEGDIHEISFEHNGEEWVYKVDLNNGSEESEVVVSHDSEEVIDVRTEQEDDDDNDNEEDIVDYASLNEAYDAIDEAIADLGGGEVKEWSLSMDDGVPEYDIDLEYENQTHEYTINAETLEILESDQDD